MAISLEKGNMPHIFWIDMNQDGVYTECAVMKRDNMGNVYYFQLNSLDDIDKRRLSQILSNRNAESFELWDLMSNITLNNGVNALTYFHQLVQVITPNGQRMKPQEGVIGLGSTGVMDTRNEDDRKELADTVAMAAGAAADAAARAATKAIKEANSATIPVGSSPKAPKAPKSPGRPKKAT